MDKHTRGCLIPSILNALIVVGQCLALFHSGIHGNVTACCPSSYKKVGNIIQSFGQMSFEQTSFGQTSFGQTSFGQTPFEQTSFGQTTLGQATVSLPTLRGQPLSWAWSVSIQFWEW